MIFNRSIFFRFFFILSVLAVFSYLFAIGAYEWVNYEKQYRELQYKLDSLLATQSIILAEPLHRGNYDQVKMVMASVISDPDITGIEIYDKDGRIIDSYGEISEKINDLTKDISIDYVEENDIIKTGLLRICLTNSNVVEKIIGQIKYDIILFFTLLILLGVCTYIAYKHTIGIGLSSLLNCIKRYNSTGHHEQLTWHRDDEMGSLINTFNDMQLRQIQDISNARELTEKLSYQASHDSLTSLINRREFEVRLKNILKSSHSNKSEHVLCYLDLDQFKIVNDTCGHTAGDELLRQISALLKEKLRARDTIGRLGGDEFGILMEHCSLTNALNTVETIREIIHQFQFTWEGSIFNIGASIGLADIKEFDDVNELLKAADTACYAAKDLGRNRVHVYKEDDAQLLKRQGEMMWVSHINKALKENQFFLVSQTIQDTSHATTSAGMYEILLRMKNDSGEIILPDSFLPAAERYGLASKIDRWVIKKTIETITNDNNLFSNLSICSINLSGQSIDDKSLLEFVELTFDTYPEIINKVCFEITETAAINNFSNALHFINTLKKRGCLFALDDFGSGVSSFAYLKNLPIDFIKIDGMFIKDITINKANYAMVKSINDIGHVMGKKTIAEYAENDEISATLREIGVDHIQGYSISKPIRFSE